MKEKEINYYLKDSKDKKSKILTPIFLNFSYHGERLRMSTGISIAPNNWDFSTRLPKKSFSNYLEVKEMLGLLEKELIICYKTFLSKGIIPTNKSLKESIQQKNKLKRETEILDFHERYSEFLKEKGLEVKELTLKKYRTLIDLIKEFEGKQKYPVRFDRIDSNFEKLFKNHLISVKKHKNDTVSKYLECLKVFLDWALQKDFHKNTTFKNFKTPKTKPDVVYLSFEELSRLIDLNLQDNKRLEKVRDMFCFQCLTGQRFSDIDNLRWKEIVINKDNQLEWHLFQQKGNKQKKLEILITPDALLILNRRKKGDPNINVFEKISNQKYNVYIKELCKVAQINDYIVDRRYSGKKAIDKSGLKYNFISSHTARRTYVTISHQRGMDTKSIMDTTGHEDARTMNRYLGSHKEHTFNQMSKAWTR